MHTTIINNEDTKEIWLYCLIYQIIENLLVNNSNQKPSFYHLVCKVLLKNKKAELFQPS